MGEKPDEYEAGNPCGFCWGIGKTFGDYPTPKRLYMTGSGFVGGCAPANTTVLMTQDAGNPCLYTGQEGVVLCSFQMQVANTQFSIRVEGGECFVKAEGLCVLESTIGAKHVSVH